VHAAAEAFVGAADDEQDFLVLAFEGFGLGFVEDGLGGLVEATIFMVLVIFWMFLMDLRRPSISRRVA